MGLLRLVGVFLLLIFTNNLGFSFSLNPDVQKAILSETKKTKKERNLDKLKLIYNYFANQCLIIGRKDKTFGDQFKKNTNAPNDLFISNINLIQLDDKNIFIIVPRLLLAYQFIGCMFLVDTEDKGKWQVIKLPEKKLSKNYLLAYDDVLYRKPIFKLFVKNNGNHYIVRHYLFKNKTFYLDEVN